FDTAPYTSESIMEVVKTLGDAIVLVAVVVLLFLQNWRSAIIPLVAVPVAIVGTFAVMAAIGFSLNNLTLFGLVLAIGIVVDDAIVVVEAVAHNIEPWLAFPVAGGWLGWEFLTPSIVHLAERLPPGGLRLLADFPPSVSPWIFPVATGLVGAIAGVAVASPLNRLLGIFFRAFNAGFR